LRSCKWCDSSRFRRRTECFTRHGEEHQARLKNNHKMKKEEKIAKSYLQHIGAINIVYEPDGNIPPDFLVDGEIAVEVRRLNQHYVKGEEPEPLEELEFSLLPKIKSLFKEYAKVPSSYSVYVTVDFERPLEVSKDLIREIKKELDLHISMLDQKRKVNIAPGLSLAFMPASKRHESLFVTGITIDGDSGGLVVANIYDHLPLMLKDKEKKVKNYFPKYKTWWLLLIDAIGYNMEDHDWQQLNANPPTKTIFDKIILVSPIDYTNGNEIKTEKILP